MDRELARVLAEASPVQDKLEEVVKRAFHIGNGDVTALIMGNENGLSLSITKNDVWDKRLITEEDHDILTDDEIRKYAMETAYGERNLFVNLDSNAPITGGKDSYDRPYPCPVICARLFITADMEGAVHRLDLETAKAESVLRSGKIRFYIAYNHNILIVEGWTEENKEEVIPVCHVDMEPPVIVTKDDCQVLLQHMPGDIDVADYYYAVAWKRFSSSRLAISVHVANSADDAAAGAAGELNLFGNDETVYEEHKNAWDAYWSRSFVEMDDKLLQAVWYRNTYLLGSCAKSGCASPALFTGLNSDTPFWHGDYHMNYNYQSVFAGAYITNHCDVFHAFVFESRKMDCKENI